MRFSAVTALLGLTLLACVFGSILFSPVAAQSVTDSSEAPPDVQFESQISVEGSLQIAIFVIAAILLVRWVLREKRQPGKRYHRSFAPLHEDGAEKRDRYRADGPDEPGDTPESGGGHGGSD